jgi:hypothetical protein
MKNHQKTKMRIVCQNILSVFAWGNREIHELAHYIDDTYRFSSTDEFKKYFSLYSKDYEPRCDVTKGYQNVSEKEFFAVLYNDIMRCSDIITLNLPEDLYNYMKMVFKKTENINI